MQYIPDVLNSFAKKWAVNTINFSCILKFVGHYEIKCYLVSSQIYSNWRQYSLSIFLLNENKSIHTILEIQEDGSIISHFCLQNRFSLNENLNAVATASPRLCYHPWSILIESNDLRNAGDALMDINFVF